MRKTVCLLLLIIFAFSLYSCAKVDYIKEHIDLVKAKLDENGYSYVDVCVEGNGSNDYIVVNQTKIHTIYTQRCGATVSLI